MSHSSTLVEVLKRELRARGITYAEVAQRLELSQGTVKRMFSQHDLSLKRIDQICELAQIEFSGLAEMVAREDARVDQLTLAQEQEIISSIKLFLVAVCVMNHATFDEIVATYRIEPAECIALLLRLDRMKFLKLLPNNRVRLLVSPALTWRPGGPLQQLFREIAGDFLQSRFDHPDEFLTGINGILSKASRAAFRTRLRHLIEEFANLAKDDSRLPITNRRPMTLVVGLRHWQPAAFAAMRRARRAQARLVSREMTMDTGNPRGRLQR